MSGLSITQLLLVALQFLMALGFGLTNEPELRAGLCRLGRNILGERIFSTLDNQLTLFGAGSLVTAIWITLGSEKDSALHVFGICMFVVAWLFFVLGALKPKLFIESGNHGTLKKLVSALGIGALFFAAFFILPAKQQIIPSQLGQLGPVPASTRPSLATAETAAFQVKTKTLGKRRTLSGGDTACTLPNCPAYKIRAGALELANAIDGAYKDYRQKSNATYVRFAQLSEDDKQGIQAEEFRFSIEALKDMTMQTYRNRYRPNAHPYRVALETLLGPAAHDARKDDLYDVADQKTTFDKGGHTIFLSNYQIDNLPGIAADLRSLAVQLPER